MANETITIEITAEDAANCKKFTDSESCLLATACKRQVLNFRSCSMEKVTIDERQFKVLGNGSDQVYDAYKENGRDIELPFTPFTVTLERIG